ncbi:hypothetical protein R1sor_017232 [Riccia sorocarpa]|uniref:Uncharacterized protein n=1 Tax=Riccia sorocarpa TaxID=122646 RepID=A0ABD3I674_9MARC
MGREDVAYVDAGGPALFLNRSVSPASSCSSSSCNSEMKPRAMARFVGAQKNAARHRMTKQDYEMIVTYLENQDNFAAINGCGRKTKITGKTLTKVTAFGHMAVTLCAQGFVKCSGVIMGKKVARYISTYKNARTFYLGTGSGLTEAEIAAGLTLEQKMNAKCHYFFRMHALYGARANVEPPAVGDAGLPAEIFFDDRGLCQDSQTAFQFFAADPMLSGDEEEAADREEEPIDLSEDDKVDNRPRLLQMLATFFFETAMLEETGGDAFYQTAQPAEDGGPEMGNQTGRSAVDVETNAATGPRTERERARIQEGIEAMRRARADRRSTLLAEMVKTGKSMDEIHQAFLLLDSVEERLSGSM